MNVQVSSNVELRLCRFTPVVSNICSITGAVCIHCLQATLWYTMLADRQTEKETDMYFKFRDEAECGRSHIIECDSASWGQWNGVDDGETWYPLETQEEPPIVGDYRSIFLYRRKGRGIECVQALVLPNWVDAWLMNDDGKTVDRI